MIPSKALRALAICATLLSAFVAPAVGTAATTTFYGFDSAAGPGGPHPNSDIARTNFLSALLPAVAGVESFETHANGSFLNSSINVSYPATAVTGTIVDQPSDPGFLADVQSTNTINYFAITGSKFIRVETNGNSNFVQFTFSSPITALGFYGTSFSDYGAFPPVPVIPPIAISLGGGPAIATLNVAPNSIPAGSVNFFGVISDTPFSSALLMNPLGTSGDGIALDDIFVAQAAIAAVPEPSTWALMLVGLAGVVYATRRKPRAA